MFSSVLEAVFFNTFLHYLIVPFSSGTFFKTATILGAGKLAGHSLIAAHLFGAFAASTVNFVFGYLVFVFLKKAGKAPAFEPPELLICLATFCFVPFLSGFIAFTMGILNRQLWAFVAFSFLGLAIYSTGLFLLYVT